ncbi:MAG: EAL domain-containing protein [Ectothiorhodospiraceae bacterium]|nr:EAL domain-containing protein [Ectothiorhodospiraceae bacterium]
MASNLSQVGWSLAESEILEQIATGAELPEILEQLTMAIDRTIPGGRSSVLLVSADGRHLEHGAAPGLPEAFTAAIDPLPVAEGVGSCGTAAARGRQVIVEDTATDPLWKDFRDLADTHGLAACWSIPVLGRDGQVLATFAVYYRKPGAPRDKDQALLHRAAHLVAVAVEHHRARTGLEQTNRALRMLSRCNEALIRAVDESELLQAVCDIAVDIGGYRMAWAGYAEQDDFRTLRPVAVAGNDRGYAFGNRYSWSGQSEFGRGPAGVAVRERRSVFVADILEEPGFQPWLERAREQGYRGCVCIPLLNQGDSIGVVVFFTGDVLELPAAERKLLQDLADDLAFGIGTLRSRRRQERLEQAVAGVAAALSARPGEDFFGVLACAMAENLGADSVGIVRVLEDPVRGPVVQTLHVVLDGETLPNCCYPLSGTPCAQAWLQSDSLCLDDVAELFPEDEGLAAMGARSYIAQRLESAAGRPLGLIYAAFRSPVQDTETPCSTLRIFAVRTAAEMERQLNEQRTREQAALLELTRDAVLLSDWDGRILFWNQGAARTYGYSPSEAQGRGFPELLAVEPDAFRAARQALERTGEWSGELRMVRSDGGSLVMDTRWSLAPADADGGRRILQIGTDATDRKRDEARIHQLAYFDSVTGLPNRVNGLQRLTKAVDQAAARGRRLHVLMLNLNRFKDVNSSLGHDMGDQALVWIGERFRLLEQDQVFVSRLGGDEFLAIVEGLDDAGVSAVADRLGALVARPLSLMGQRVELELSTGIARYPEDAGTPDQLLQCAAIAMRVAKAADCGYRLYETHMSEELQQKLALARRFSMALRGGVLELHYQPQVRLETGRLIGVEALLRWCDPEWGAVSPDRFIPVAEERHMMGRVGDYVVSAACRQLAAWRADGLALPGPMSLNVAAQQLENDELIDVMQDAVSAQGLAPSAIGLEVTETGLMRDPEQARRVLHSLNAMGFDVSIDDFGTGYSSLAYLGRFPANTLKIDMSFVHGMLEDSRQRAIVAAIIGMAGNLGVATMAEGVETREQATLLREMGCELGQGYLYGRPLPAEDFARTWLVR